MLISELPLLSREAAAPAVSERPGGADLPGGGRQPAPPEPPAPAPEPPRLVPGAPGEPLVLIYHSHTSETYREPGRELLPAASYHRFNSRETGVVRAGAALAQALEARGVPALHDTGVYDYPSHPSAYLESGRAVAALLRQHPSIRAVIDLHRDTPADMTATVGGRKVARVTLVVATAVTSGLPHPGWRQNLAFAQTLARMMNERTPGLLDRILQVPSRRYNQELHPHALLVEVGSYHNTQEEADAAAELLAESLAEAVLAAGARSGPPAAEGRETP
ncbi:stage II sporulation protein P [Limnochorda pilosa]|uniref:stage II sporulation protein P n=1 Tax=Limnochorda pilosa TaxID=1555112 RepID=UPI00130D9D28|nr:stage II sporulation protein P [Limnochorda pilosa]